MRNLTLLAIVSVFGAGCAHIPPVNTTYYGARTDLNIKVTRTLACSKASTPIVATTVTPSVTHRADPSRKSSLNFADVGRRWSEANLTAEFREDGRLAGVNATTTGQGGAIVDAAVALVSALEQGSGAAPDFQADCIKFRQAFADKTLTVIFEGNDNFAVDADGALKEVDVDLEPDWQSREVYNEYKNLFGSLCYDHDDIFEPAKPVETTGNVRGASIMAWQPSWQTVFISVGPQGNCNETVWKARVPVAQAGTPYSIPIPAGALFGKQTFEAAFDESGALKKLTYGSSDSSSGLESLGQIVGEIDETDAERLASIKLEADIIAAQQRVVKCRANPEDC